MSDNDFSSFHHRVDNLSHHKFVQAYARIRHHIIADEHPDGPTPWLKGYVKGLDQELALAFGVPITTLRDMLTDQGLMLCHNKDGQEQAESAEG